MVDIKVHILFSDIKTYTNSQLIYELICPNHFSYGPLEFEGPDNYDIKTAKLPLQPRSQYEEILKQQQKVKFSIQVWLRTIPELVEVNATPRRGRKIGKTDFEFNLNLPYVERPEWKWLELTDGHRDILVGRMYVQTCVKFLEQKIRSNSRTSASEGISDIQPLHSDETYRLETPDVSLMDSTLDNSVVTLDVVPKPKFVLTVDEVEDETFATCTPCNSPRSVCGRKPPEIPTKQVTAFSAAQMKQFRQFSSQLMAHDDHASTSTQVTKGQRKKRQPHPPSVSRNTKPKLFNISMDSPFFTNTLHEDTNKAGTGAIGLEDPEISRKEESFYCLDVDHSFAQYSPNQTMPSVSTIQYSMGATPACPKKNEKKPEYDPWGRLVTGKNSSRRKQRRSSASIKSQKK